MNWDQIEGKWEQMKGNVKKHWGKLTDDDLTFMRDRLVAVAQQARELITTFMEAARSSVEPIEVLRVIRRFAPLQETLYPLAGVFDPRQL